MKVLYIGGTGEISLSCVRRSVAMGHDVVVFNRGRRESVLPGGVRQIVGDIADGADYGRLGDEHFDAVCQFMAFSPADIERDIRIFNGHCGQYVFISSATVYSKPVQGDAITEDAPVGNDAWDYAHLKCLCESTLSQAGFRERVPFTIVRPSHTYRRRIPSGVIDGYEWAWRVLEGKPVILHGDGNSLWTYTHSDDFAVPFVGLLGNYRAFGEAFHITRHLETYTWREIYEAYARALGRELDLVCVPVEKLIEYSPRLEGPLKGDKAWPLVFDNTKVIEATGGKWECEVSLDEGVLGAAEHFINDIIPYFIPDSDQQELADRIVAEQR